MIRAHWEEYSMPEVERQYLDRYLTNQKQTISPESKPEDFFARFCIAQILKTKDLSMDEREDGYVSGPYDGGIDGAYLFVAGKFVTDDMEPSDLDDYEGLTLSFHLVQATQSAHFTAEQLRKFEDTSKDLLDLTKNVDANPELYNAAVRGMMRRFRNWWSALQTKLPTTTITFHVASKGDDIHQNVKTRAEGLKAIVGGLYPCQCDVLFYNAKTLLEMAKTPRRSPVTLKFTPPHVASASLGNAYAVLVPLPDYINFLVTPNGERRDYILEPNVRAFLGAKGINSQILATLTSATPYTEEFWWLNNGVTITASKVTPSINSLLLTEARLVNGLQTSRMIYQYYKEKAEELKSDQRHILVKVIEAAPKVARHIVTTTNSQTKVDPIYLRTSTDPIHDKIEAALPDFGFHYERVKNQYYEDETVLPKQIVSLPYLTRAIIAIFMQDPGSARGGPDKFAQKHYPKMFSPNSKPDFFGHIAQIMKRVDQYLIAEVPLKNDRTNLCYYLAYDATCSILKKSHLQRGLISQMNMKRLTDDLLARSLQRVNGLYKKLISRGIEPDLVGKGREFTTELKAELSKEYPVRLRRKKAPA
ncbi:MAG: AIPR family protein [Candidatus Sulfotelmatobacter sp.]